MSYLPQAGFYDFLMGGSGSSGWSYDKTPPGSPDFIRLYSVIVGEAYKKFGTYLNPDGTQMRSGSKGYPVLTVEDAASILKYWILVAKKALEMISNMDGGVFHSEVEPLQKLNAILTNFTSRYYAWKQAAYATATEYEGRALGFKTVEYLFSTTILPFALELNNLKWSTFNIESPAERISWAVKSSVKDVAVGITRGVAAVADSAGNIMKFGFDITKWAMVAAVALGGVFLISKMKKD